MRTGLWGAGIGLILLVYGITHGVSEGRDLAVSWNQVSAVLQASGVFVGLELMYARSLTEVSLAKKVYGVFDAVGWALPAIVVFCGSLWLTHFAFNSANDVAFGLIVALVLPFPCILAAFRWRSRDAHDNLVNRLNREAGKVRRAFDRDQNELAEHFPNGSRR